MILQFLHRPSKYLWKLFLDEVPFLLGTNSGVHSTSCMQTNVDGCLANTTAARVDQHWLTFLHVPNHHQCIVSLSMTKWSNKYTFIYLIYIKTAGILFTSTILPRCFWYPVGKVNFGLKIIQLSLTWSSQSSQWKPEGIHSLRHMITIIMIIINILYRHLSMGYLQLYTWNKPCF